MSKIPTRRPKLRWEDDVLEDIRSMNVCNWKNVTQNRDRWKRVAEQARTLNRLQRFTRRRRGLCIGLVLQDRDEVKFGPYRLGVTTNLAHTKIKFTSQLYVWTHYFVAYIYRTGWEIKLANRES